MTKSIFFIKLNACIITGNATASTFSHAAIVSFNYDVLHDYINVAGRETPNKQVSWLV